MKDIQFNEPAFEITKSYRDDNGQMFVEGIASTTSIDATGERMSTEAIAKMAARLVGKPLRSEHGKGWDDKLGEIVQADIKNGDDNRPALWIKARLFDWSSKARDLFQMLSSGIEKMGLSVAGMIKPGGIVKEFSDALGKFIPTYHDVEPTEVSVTDHPANLDTWAVAVAKSINLDEVQDEAQFNKDKYDDVSSDDFLDPDNSKYPIDEAHLLPALRYFNHEGQRSAGDYTSEQWAVMGRKLASRLNAKSDAKYEYNESSERVERIEEKGKGVNNVDKSKLVSKTVPKEVADLVKTFNPTSDVKTEEVKVEKKVEDKKDDKKVVEKAEEPKKDDVKKDSISDTSTSSDAELSAKKADTSTTTTSTPSDSKTVGKDDKSRDLEDVLKELGSSLSAIKDSLGGTSTPTTTDTSTDTDSDEGDLASALEMCMGKMKKWMDKYGKAKKAAPADGTQTSTSTTTTNTPVPEKPSETAKAQEQKIADLEKVIKSLTDKVDAIPNVRKGVAVMVEKNLGDEKPVEKKEEAKESMLDKIKNDPEVSMAEFHKFRNFGILPKKYDVKKAE